MFHFQRALKIIQNGQQRFDAVHGCEFKQFAALALDPSAKIFKLGLPALMQVLQLALLPCYAFQFGGLGLGPGGFGSFTRFRGTFGFCLGLGGPVEWFSVFRRDTRRVCIVFHVNLG